MKTTKEIALPQPALSRKVPRRWFRSLWTLTLLLLLRVPASLEAEDYTYTTNEGAITITGYSGPGGVVNIPGTLSGLPVIAIGDFAFAWHQELTSVTLPDSVASLDTYAFYNCNFLTNVTLGNGVTDIGGDAFDACQGLPSITIPDNVINIGDSAFFSCTRLTNVWIGSGVTAIAGGAFAACTSLNSIAVDTNNLAYSSLGGVLCDKSQITLVQCPAGRTGCYSIPDTVTSIGFSAFEYCRSLTSVFVPAGVTSVGSGAFSQCTGLSGVYFHGNAPTIVGWNVFFGADNATVYYLPGTTSWGSTFGGRPTALWLPQVQTADNNFGVRTNAFGFNITWASGTIVVVEACTNVANPAWIPVSTNVLAADMSYFSDPQWTNYHMRFYRLRAR